MSEQTTATPTTPTEGEATSEAVPANLLASTETVAKPEQQLATLVSDTAKPTEEAKPAEVTKPEGAPESYDFKAPEGKEYDATVLEPFSAAAKEANLTQDAAQKLLNSMAPKLAERQQAQVTAIQTGWLEASKTDKEFGGDKLQENLSTAKKALDTFATPEFKKLLDDTGLGNNPEVIRMLIRVGKNVSEDGFVAGSAAPNGQRNIAAKLYPNTPNKE